MTSMRTFLRFLYRSAYFLLYLVLLALLLITPVDAIERSIRNGQTYNILIVAACYVATIIVVLFIYALRLYSAKSVVAAIPRTDRLDKPELKKHVFGMIQAGLSRSAAIALGARPRIRERREDGGLAPASLRASSNVGGSVTAGRKEVWGEIEHPGWASPNSPDLPNLQYDTVLAELPNLIEAQALTLAPPDPLLSADEPILDPEAVAVLQRQPQMGLRDYLDHLVELGVLAVDQTTADFVALYENARFSTRPLSEARFREIMRLFAEVLRNIGTLDFPIATVEDRDGYQTPSDVADDASSGHAPSTPRIKLSRTTSGNSFGSVRRAGRASSANTWHQYLTAPNTPSGGPPEVLLRQSSNNSFAQSRRPYPVSQPSSASLRSKMSGTSASTGASGSVIRLSTREDSAELPYVLNLRDTRGTV